MLATALQGTRDRRKGGPGAPELRRTRTPLRLVPRRLRGIGSVGGGRSWWPAAPRAPEVCVQQQGPRGGALLGTSFCCEPNLAHRALRCPVSPECESKGQVMPFSSCRDAPSTTAPFPPPQWTPPGAPLGPEELTPGWGRSQRGQGKLALPAWPGLRSSLRVPCQVYVLQIPSFGCVLACASLHGMFYEQSCNLFYEQRSNGSWSRRHPVLQGFQGYHAVSLN